MKKFILYPWMLSVTLISCQPEEEIPTDSSDPYPAITAATYLNPDDLPDYVNQSFPVFYDNGVFANFDNTPSDNMITNEGATLGRVLFYDVALSRNRSVSCASCHAPNEAFSDPSIFSTGFDGRQTDVHSMRLANARFYEGGSFFWDKRAATLEDQTTQPIQNELEMGFDASHGGMNTIIARLDSIDYYRELFELAFGDDEITEDRIQKSLAQFIRSIISVSSRFDEAYADVYDEQAPGNGIGIPFPDFTPAENRGKNLFLAPPANGGAGCAGCHIPPTFSLDETSLSNGLDAGETTVFKSPSLKTIENQQRFMHDGRFSSLSEVIEHYNSGIQEGPALDNRLRPGGTVMRLNFTATEKSDMLAFLLTLQDRDAMNADKYSNPFR